MAFKGMILAISGRLHNAPNAVGLIKQQLSYSHSHLFAGEHRLGSL